MQEENSVFFEFIFSLVEVGHPLHHQLCFHGFDYLLVRDNDKSDR